MKKTIVSFLILFGLLVTEVYATTGASVNLFFGSIGSGGIASTKVEDDTFVGSLAAMSNTNLPTCSNSVPCSLCVYNGNSCDSSTRREYISVKSITGSGTLTFIIKARNSETAVGGPDCTGCTHASGDKFDLVLTASKIASILSSSDIVTQTITNGVTTTAPSEDAVYDALATKVSGTVKIVSYAGAPTANDDTPTYSINDEWTDTTTGLKYIAKAVTDGAAVWVRQGIPRAASGQICISTGATTDCEMTDTIPIVSLSSAVTATTQTQNDNSTKIATTAYVDRPTLVAAGTGATLVGPSEYYVCTGTCTVTVPVPVAGYEFCVYNDNNVSTAITLSALGSSARYENSARTAYGTAGTGTLVLSAAAGNKVCIVGRDSTHYSTISYNGAVTVN